jgi:cell division protein FtsA
VVEPRYEELFTLVQAELQRSGFEGLMAAGIVLTGGSARMEGAVELAEEVFHMPVRQGIPQYVSGLQDVLSNPIYATAVGLLIFGNENQSSRMRTLLHLRSKGWIGRMKSWFQGNF